MDIIQVLLALSDINDERNRVDPRKPLAVFYREIRELKNAIDAAEKKIDYLRGEDQDAQSEMDQLIIDGPRWVDEIAKAKDRMIRQRELTLKEMLVIQQEVVRLEDSMYYGEARVAELRDMKARYDMNRRQLSAKRKEMKTLYNERAEVYNREKAEADRVIAAFARQEDDLLEGLKPEERSIYREALRMNPENPVAMVDGDICNGCRIVLSKQLVKNVNHGNNVIFCENCLRILLPRV